MLKILSVICENLFGTWTTYLGEKRNKIYFLLLSLTQKPSSERQMFWLCLREVTVDLVHNSDPCLREFLCPLPTIVGGSFEVSQTQSSAV
jgi:hypothetical protein